jgi:hypothetical protein
MFYVFLLFKYIRAVMVVTSESAGASFGGSSGRATTFFNSLSPLSPSISLHTLSLYLSLQGLPAAALRGGQPLSLTLSPPSLSRSISLHTLSLYLSLQGLPAAALRGGQPLSLILSPPSLSPSLSLHRGFLRRLFGEGNPAARNFKGTAWLFLGVANKDSLLYDEEIQAISPPSPRSLSLSVGDAFLYYEQVMRTHVHTLASS